MCGSAIRARARRDAGARGLAALCRPPAARGRASARAWFCAALLAALGASPRARAQEIRIAGPLATATEIYAVTGQHIPKRTDSWLWLSLGGTPAPDRAAGPFGGLGGQITNGLVRLPGLGPFPSELRWGPWGQLWADGTGGRAEGGLAAQLYLIGRGVHTPVDVRFGAGYGEDTLGKTPHLALTISGGPRYIEGVSWHHVVQQIEVPQLLAGWRFFLSGRRTLEAAPHYWVTGGIELELGTTWRADPSHLDEPL